MSDSSDILEPTSEDETAEPRPTAAPIDSRFLFVDIAAMRAKQLRRGARPRLGADEMPVDLNRPQPRKAERVAMEEVRRGLVHYDIRKIISTPPGEADV